MRLIYVVVLALISGCVSSTEVRLDPAVLLVDEDVSTGGTPVTMRLVNTSDREVGYNLCDAVLERRSNGLWQPAEVGRSCFSIRYSLQPRSQAVEIRVLPSDLVPGVYRFTAPVTVDVRGRDSSHRISSSEFEVR